MPRIKLYTAVVVCLIVFQIHSIAQFSVGVRTGWNTSSFFIPAERVFIEDKAGFELAIPVEYRFNEWITAQSELNYIRKGASFSRPSPVNTPVGRGLLRAKEGDIRLDYVQIPLLVKFSPEFDHWGFSTFMGPFIGLFAGGNIDQTFGELSEDLLPENTDLVGGASADISPLELGATLGASFYYIPQTRRITLERRPAFTFDVRYHWGLTDIDAQRSFGNVKNRSFVISMGYIIPIGKRRGIY